MSDLVGNSEDRFSQNEAHIKVGFKGILIEFLVPAHQGPQDVSMYSCKLTELLSTGYRKVPKFWDTKNICCNLPKIQTKMSNLKGYMYLSKCCKWNSKQ